MIIIPCEQGSPEWIAARVGLPTSSQFHRILTPKTLKPSSAQEGYLCSLLAEWMIGASLDETVTQFMERGTELEDHAVSFYEMQREVDTQKVGFITTDDGKAGCSPDALVGDEGGLEIKAPSASVHVQYMLGGQSKYTCQIQGALWITGRKWWDFMSYHPEMPPALIRYERDEKVIEALKREVTRFADCLDEAKETLIKKGYAPCTQEMLRSTMEVSTSG